MQRFTDQTSLAAMLGISLSMAAITTFAATPIAEADDVLGSFTLASGTQRSTLVEPAPTVLTRKDAAPRRAIPTALTDVRTSEDLEAYAASLLRDDPKITRIEFSPKRVTMAYRSQESVAGFGLRTVERTITITSDGYVYVNRPWYTQGGGSTDAPESGFTDLYLPRTADGFTPEAEARLLTRMQGRFAIGAI